MTDPADAPKPEEPKPSAAVVPAARRVMADVFDLGRAIATVEAGERAPSRAEIAAGCVRAHFVRTRGLPDDAAFRVWFLRGQFVLGADVYRALARAAGYRIERVESTDTSCTARLLDANGNEVGETTYTIEEAQRAGLVRPKGNYETQPRRMLWARASAFVVRDYTSVVFAMDEDEARDWIGDDGRQSGPAEDAVEFVEAEFTEEPLDEAAQFEAERELAAEAAAAADRDLAEAANAERAEDLGPPRAEGEA